MDKVLVEAWVTKKPVGTKNFGIGSQKRRYLVLFQDRLSYFKDSASFRKGESPLGSLTIDHDFSVIPPGIDNDFVTFTSSSSSKELKVIFELTSQFEEFQSRIIGIKKGMKFKDTKASRDRVDSPESSHDTGDRTSEFIAQESTISVESLSSSKMALFNCMTQEGQGIIKFIEKNSSIQQELRCIVSDEDEKECLECDISELVDHPRIQIEVADYTDAKDLTRGLGDSKIAIICAASDNPEMVETTKRCIDAVSESKCDVQILLSSCLASLPNSNFALIEKHLNASSQPSCCLRVPFLMENFLLFAEEILSSDQLSLPINPEWEFSTLCCEDIAASILSILSSPEPQQYFLNGKYTLTSFPLIALDTIIDILNEYKEESKEIKYKMMNMDDFKHSKLAEGLQEWWLEQHYLPYFTLINQSSKVVTHSNNDFFDIVGRKPKNFEDWLEENISSFVEIESESVADLHSPRDIKDEKRKLKLAKFRQSASTDDESF